MDSDKKKEAAPFFKALKNFALTKADMWSTPGHGGGQGLKSSVLGREFYEFFGKNIFRADISSSVPSLGTILDHEGAAEDAEKNAAEIFGADTTFFVLNGTSTANKVVFFATCAPGDIVLVGRNCHKSIMHSIILNEVTPIYLKPAKNSYGLIGPVPQSEFTHEAIKQKIKESPIVTNKRIRKVQLTVLTNSTYDGLIYDVDKIKEKMSALTHFLHFDEAWYAYGHFHPFYANRYAMSPYQKKRGVKRPPVFATQSTHKLLWAFSQGSMLHYKMGTNKFELDVQGLKEANLFHASTSPFYPLFASIDISAAIMDSDGEKLMGKALDEAIKFRKEIINRYKKHKKADSWYFELWQQEMKLKHVNKDPKNWIIDGSEPWHGFEGLEKENVLLDPLKVTLLTPGIEENGEMQPFGIPASIVSKFLNTRKIIPEKTGFYNILFLFAPGVGEQKEERLVKALDEFKTLYDRNEPISGIFPELINDYPHIYTPEMGLKDLANKVHDFLYINQIFEIIPKMYNDLPEQVMAPHKAYYGLVDSKAEYLSLDEIAGRVAVFMILPYPPGIPLIMPGERFPQSGGILDFLRMSERFDNMFPGFSTEFHGVKKIENEDGKIEYRISCLKRSKKEAAAQ
ncbi:Lysine decarboxylase [Elusimicrobium minutum Pei191]|uniref:Lysine decarboxylase n=1 Tax=Elusimicrobium minutum (strain Pei191) TaxID=445932 RepID=B2KDG6_ELUMP|nr:beta-eliminating lyase-related protein [Elusimicrobium minutum]ACC98562.1 Lysine decarboxylase [Elusimicrobium minutum Pei191]